MQVPAISDWSIGWIALFCLSCCQPCCLRAAEGRLRLRVIVETDAGGDPDDEQSLVRFLLYANEWDVEGIIANRPQARDGENENAERTGLGIVRRMIAAYGECRPNLVRHDPRYPSSDDLLKVTVPGYGDTDEAVNLIIAAVDADDPRPIWYSDWGTDDGAGMNTLRRALDRVLAERGPESYARFKSRLRLASADAFGEHTYEREPPFPLWIDTFRPEIDHRRWYHTFSRLTATAGGFDIERDLRTKHGPLGTLYPLNTTHEQKEGDTMTFLYLVPTGMSDPQKPTWGGWAGRYGLNAEHSGKPYYWADVRDGWSGTAHRDNTLARWAVALQHDFAARADWCVAETVDAANHRPTAVLNGDRSQRIVRLAARAGETIRLSAAGSSDADGDDVALSWFVYREAGTFDGDVRLSADEGKTTQFTAPAVDRAATIHIILQLEDAGIPSLFAYRRAIVTIEP